MMNSKQNRIVGATFAFVAVVWLLSFLLFSVRKPAPPLSRTPLAFNAARAELMSRELVVRNPIRAFGALESRPTTGYIKERLEQYGYQFTYSHFSARTGRRKGVGRNIMGYRQGARPEMIVLAAHLDTARTTVQGAMDNGAAAGVLLELSRTLGGGRNERSILIVFTDGAEWGMLGADELARNYPERDRIAAVLSLDYVAAGDLEAFCLDETGQGAGFTPPWLRELVRRAAGERGLPVHSASGFREHLERALQIAGADQGPFLNVGIPAINLGSRSTDRRRERELYHSSSDTIENLKTVSIKEYGLAAERIARTLIELPAIPDESFAFVRLWDSRYLRPAAIATVHAVSFLPLPVILWLCFRRSRRQLSAQGLGREILLFMGTVLPLWTVYALIWLARGVRLLPTSALYPAPLKDPIIENPQWGLAMGMLALALLVALLSFAVSRYSARDLPKPTFHDSRLALLGLLLINVIVALFYNHYWAVVFLLLPAWMWGLTDRGRSAGRRVGMCLLVLAAGLPYLVILFMYGSGMQLGWNFIWYQLLALGNGMFTRTGFFVATASVALGIRFMAIQMRKQASQVSQEQPQY